jgi:hypothetical protein
MGSIKLRKIGEDMGTYEVHEELDKFTIYLRIHFAPFVKL